MEKLYEQNPYCREFDAVVCECIPVKSPQKEGGKGKNTTEKDRDGKKETFQIVLDRTAFFPEGGGQAADTGFLLFETENGETQRVRVLDTREVKENGTLRIVHRTDSAVAQGTRVRGVLDWEARFLRMQEHSGEHIISGLLHRKYGFDNVGFHMGTDEVTLDVNGVISMDELLLIEAEANRIAAENRPVHCYYPKKKVLKTLDYRSKKEIEGDVRIVEIEGADLCACCGTHVEKTGEIGMIKILSMIHYKGGMRISMVCGERARLDYENRIRQMQKISVLLSAKTDKLADAVAHQKKMLEEKEQECAAMFAKWMEAKVQTMEEGKKCLLVREDALNPQQLRQYCDALAKQEKGEVVLALKKKDDGVFQYILAARTEDVRPLAKHLNQVLSGSGGGSSQMVQGMWKAEYKEIAYEFESAECKEN